MEMKKRIIKGCAWALALVTAVSLLAIRQNVAYGATGVNENADLTLTFSLAVNDVWDEYSELKDLNIPVHYYKVADMKTPAGTYEGSLDGGEWEALKSVEYKVVQSTRDQSIEIKVKDVDEDYAQCADMDGRTRTANLERVDRDDPDHIYAWEALARMAKKLSEQKNALGTTTIEAADMARRYYAENIADHPAMYLIIADSVDSANYTYSFKPYLISVPTNLYADGTPDSDGSWVYDVEVGLKPQMEERCGRLQITKNLSDFNASLGDKASFIFEVRAEKDGDLVYSDVVQLDFTDAGQNTVTIGPEKADGVDVVGKIPAGSTVTVTEVYSGASYTAAAGTVTLDHPMQAYDEENGVVENVSFTNIYNGGVNGGSSVVNHFAYTESENGTGGNWQYVPSQSAEGGNTQ